MKKYKYDRYHAMNAKKKELEQKQINHQQIDTNESFIQISQLNESIDILMSD
jgi:hypothetical protein